MAGPAVTRPRVTEEALLGALRHGDAAAVVALFEHATDRDRARLRPAVEAADGPVGRRSAPGARAHALEAAVLSTYTARTIAERQRRRRRGDGRGVPEAVLVAAVRPRTARFRTALAKAVLAGDPAAWPFVRPLVRAGVLDAAVDDDAYIRAMATGLLGARRESPHHRLLDDPALLEREVWRLFEVRDALGQSMAPWHDALLRLSAEGRLDRNRLLDACLTGLGAGFPPGQLRWLVGFWTAMAPTGDELRARHDRLVGLLASPEPAVVKMVLAAAARLVDMGAADADAVGGLLRHPLGGPRKDLAVASLALLGDLLRRAEEDGDAARAGRLLAVAASGVAHERADVAKRALRLVGRHTRAGVPDAVRVELLRRVEAAPPTFRAAVAELAGGPPVAGELAGGPPVAAVGGALRLRPADAPAPAQPGPWAALAPDRRLDPVDGPDELVPLLAAALEGEGSADDAERALGAVVRLAGVRPAGFADLVAPVRRRAAALLEGWGAQGAPIEVAKVVMAWADGRAPRPAPASTPAEGRGGLRSRVAGLLGRPSAPRAPDEQPAAHTPAAFFAARVAEVVRAVVDGGPATALAEPTHRGGRVDPDVLATRRGGRCGDGLGPYDRRQAALRVPAGHEWPPPLRLDVVDDGTLGDGDPSAVRFVRDTPPDGAPPDPLVAAAERYFVLAGTERFNASIFRPFWDVVADGLGARLALAAFAGRPDVPAAMAAVGLAERARHAVVNWVDPTPMIEDLVDPAVPLDGAAVALLALALTGDAEYRAAGVEAAVAAVDDGRFDPVALARVTATLHRADVLPLTRLARPVADLAAAGPLHLLRAQQYLLALVESSGAHAHGLHGPLEALAQLSAGGIVVPEPARRALRSLAERPSGAGRAAAAVVANAVG